MTLGDRAVVTVMLFGAGFTTAMVIWTKPVDVFERQLSVLERERAVQYASRFSQECTRDNGVPVAIRVHEDVLQIQCMGGSQRMRRK